LTRLLVRDRITLASLAVLATGLAIIGLAVNVVLTRQLNHDAAALLHERTVAALTTLDVRPGKMRAREVSDAAIDRESWAFSRRHVIERAVAPPAVQGAAAGLAEVQTTTDRTLDEHIRLRASPVRDPAGRQVGTVVVATSLDPYEHSEQIARLATLVLTVLVLALSGLVVRRAVASALRPVAHMARSAADWSEHDLGRRLGLGPPRDELTALAATLDELLERIDAALRHEQRFSAEMAHELRTPLSGVRAEAELALQQAHLSADARQSFEQILAACDRMASAIETLLMSARGQAAPRSSDSAAAVAEVATALRPAAAAAGVEITLRDPGRVLRVGAGPDQVAGAIAPLLDNAISHARSRVVVSTAARDGRVTIAVEDDGDGLPGDEEQVFAPGASSRGGAGLGLPLARRLARACGGDVIAVPSAGGARFELRLPRSAHRD
jgi:two-component system, OmpR family, sensor kinase